MCNAVRVHHGIDDSYRCCIQEDDEEGYKGFRLTKHLVKAAGEALKANLRIQPPKVLSLHELIREAISNVVSISDMYKVCDILGLNPKDKHIRGLNMKSGTDHFCIHSGGKAVIDTVRKSLKLGEYYMELLRKALHRFGNTSAGGNWYMPGYMEAKKRLKMGDTALMTSHGTGIKSNTCMWEVLRDLKNKNVWEDFLGKYPPESPDNTLMDKYDWIYDKCLNFVRMR